jgi:membrane-bound lytic murein transglycosylase D
MNIDPVEPIRYEAVTLPTAVDLRRVAEWIGTPIQTLQDLNPELRRWTTPVRATEYELKVPDGTGDILREHLAEVGADDLAPLNWYVVKKGETLLSIAKKLKVNRVDLAEANYLTSRSRLATGQQLIIPRAPTLLLASLSDNPAPVVDGRPATDVVAASNTAPEVTPTSPASLVYRVKRGDTLFSIAKLFRTTVASLKSWNGLRNNSIKVGQRLTIFTGAANATN